MSRYIMILMRVVMMVYFFDIFNNVKGTRTYNIHETTRKYTWTTANTSCVLLGSDLTSSLLAEQVTINEGTIQSRGWIGAHVITNGTVQFKGCFFGSLNSEPGLIVTTDHVLHCNYFCNGSGFMFHKNICYCTNHSEEITDARCTGRFYPDASYVVYGNETNGKQPCLCVYEQVGDKRGEYPNKLCVTDQNLNSTLNPCHGPSYFNSIGNEVMNNDLNLVQLLMDVNGTKRTVWNITRANLETRYSTYWTGIVRKDVFVWGSYGKHPSNEVNVPLSCVSLLLKIPVMIRQRRMTKSMLFPVKSACNNTYRGICIRFNRITTKIQYPTAVSKTTNTAAQLSTYETSTAGQLGTSITNTVGHSSSSITNTTAQLSTSKSNTAGQHGTSIANTAGQLGTSIGNTAGQPGTSIANTAGQLGTSIANTAGYFSSSIENPAAQLTTMKTNTEHHTSEISTERVSSKSMHINTDKQTTIFGVKSEIPPNPNSYPSPSDVSSIGYRYSSEVKKGTGISSSLLGPVIGGVVSFVVIVIVCAVIIVCLKKRRRNTYDHGTHQLKPFSKQNLKDRVYLNNPEFVLDDEDVMGVKTDTVHQPLRNEHNYVNVQRNATEHSGNKKGANFPIGPEHDLSDLSRTNNDINGGLYDSFHTNKDYVSDSIDNYDTVFENEYGSLQKGGNTSETTDDQYNHFRNNGHNTNNTYDSFESTPGLENCSTYDYSTASRSDYGYLEKGDKYAQPVDDLYDHARGHDLNTGDTYDTFQSSQGQRDVSDNYDHFPKLA